MTAPKPSARMAQTAAACGWIGIGFAAGGLVWDSYPAGMTGATLGFVTLCCVIIAAALRMGGE